MKKYDLAKCSDFLYELEQTIEYEEKSRKLENEFLTINELIEELEYLKEQYGGDEVIHLLDIDEADSQLKDVPYVPLGVTRSSLIEHINNAKAGLVISRTKDYYRSVKKLQGE